MLRHIYLENSVRECTRASQPKTLKKHYCDADEETCPSFASQIDAPPCKF